MQVGAPFAWWGVTVVTDYLWEKLAQTLNPNPNPKAKTQRGKGEQREGGGKAKGDTGRGRGGERGRDGGALEGRGAGAAERLVYAIERAGLTAVTLLHPTIGCRV
jgi:hypothetical protein